MKFIPLKVTKHTKDCQWVLGVNTDNSMIEILSLPPDEEYVIGHQRRGDERAATVADELIEWEFTDIEQGEEPTPFQRADATHLANKFDIEVANPYYRGGVFEDD